jgi:hypothetical protein
MQAVALRPIPETRIGILTTEQELREKLRTIAALFEGATTSGERNAAAAALDRIRAALNSAEKIERAVETSFRLPDRWSRRLFLALCRRYGLNPYRYPRQRYSTVVLRAPASFSAAQAGSIRCFLCNGPLIPPTATQPIPDKSMFATLCISGSMLRNRRSHGIERKMFTRSWVLRTAT